MAISDSASMVAAQLHDQGPAAVAPPAPGATAAPNPAPTVTPAPVPPVGPVARPEWQEVRVSPRYLAGAGYNSDAAMDPLTGGAGWHAWSDELANHHLTSPCGRAYLGFLPEDHPEPVGLWKAWARPHHHGPRTWLAAFSDEVPYEFIAAFTTDWAEGYRSDDPTFAQPDSGHRDGVEKVLTVLQLAGWDRDPSTGRGRSLERWTAPDGRAGVEVRINARGSAASESCRESPAGRSGVPRRPTAARCGTRSSARAPRPA
ncbi:DUF317 domain-containing protein [Kitasatospora nipponensis]